MDFKFHILVSLDYFNLHLKFQLVNVSGSFEANQL